MSFAVTDFSGYAALRRGAAAGDPATLRAVAGQFEALFLETLLGNVRDASLADPLFGQSDAYDMYRGLLDRQLATEMASGRGIGLADLLVRQLGGGAPEPARSTAARPAGPGGPAKGALPARTAAAAPAGGKRAAAAAQGGDDGWSGPAAFARAVWPHVLAAARRIGVAPEAILAQAALETGWGRHVIPRDDGTSSFNLFGIKAGPDWQGATATRATLEYAGGVARRETARFRAYSGLEETFEDYARLIAENPRYAAARDKGADTQGFARALAASGYATDPGYAEKITRVLSSDVLKSALDGLKAFGRRPIMPLQ